VDVRNAVFGIGSRQRFLAHLARLDLPEGPGDSRPVTEDDVESLPEPAQRYMRFMGVVGRPRDWSFRVRFVGELRRAPDKRWMHAVAWQYNTSPAVARIFDMRMDFGGVLPMFGSDTYVAGRGRMSGKLLNVLKVVDGSGREFDLGELVTYLNDACLVAPSMLLNDYVSFTPVDDRSFDVTLSDAGNTVTARVFVGADGRLADFGTTDRWFAGPDGLVHARWTTPIEGWITNGDRRLPSRGRAVWHLETGEFEYAWGRFEPLTLEFNVPPITRARSPRGPATGERRIGHASLDALSGVPLFVTAPLIRRWHMRWGATDAEVARPMPGDEIVPKASFNATRAITIDAPPEQVWPWIVQMGYRRAGFYTYALLDNAGYESADRIVLEYQEPKVGDWMPMSKKVNETTAFKVKAFEPSRWLVWEKPDSTWSWKLVPMNGDRTRLLTRLKQRYAWEKPASALSALVLLEFGDFPMIRRVLKGIKARAENWQG
jgi:hypothetical protein